MGKHVRGQQRQKPAREQDTAEVSALPAEKRHDYSHSRAPAGLRSAAQRKVCSLDGRRRPGPSATAPRAAAPAQTGVRPGALRGWLARTPGPSSARSTNVHHC